MEHCTNFDANSKRSRTRSN